MKAVILAGGRGTRMQPYSGSRPKPLVEIAGTPLLDHLVGLLARHGVDEILVATGHGAAQIQAHLASMRCKVPLRSVDTGEETETAGRLRRLAPFLQGEPHFLMTYADGLADIDLAELEAFHRAHGRAATVTVVRRPDRYGRLRLDGHRVEHFVEKPGHANEEWINAGFFILAPSVLELIPGDATVWEREPMETLVAGDHLRAFRHHGFWHGVDTPEDVALMEALWSSGRVPLAAPSREER